MGCSDSYRSGGCVLTKGGATTLPLKDSGAPFGKGNNSARRGRLNPSCKLRSSYPCAGAQGVRRAEFPLRTLGSQRSLADSLTALLPRGTKTFPPPPPSRGNLQFPRPLSLTRHSSLPRKAGSSGESLKLQVNLARQNKNAPGAIASGVVKGASGAIFTAYGSE